MNDIRVWEKGGGHVDFDTESGYFSADEPGWWGPDDFTLVGIYSLMGDKAKDFNQFVDDIMEKIPEEYQDKIVIEPTTTDLFWVYFGNGYYFSLTGQHGQESPWDYYILNEEEREEYYVTYDNKAMEQAVDDFILEKSTGKAPEDLAEDSKYKDKWYEEFIDYAINTLEFEQVKM